MGRFDDEAFDTLFLDRDGVINRLRPDDYVKNWEEFEFMPGMLDRLARWSGSGAFWSSRTSGASARES